jgi:DNA-directed RNA polymerase alpha subunit
MKAKRVDELPRGLQTPIGELDLSTRAHNVLYASGFTRVVDILTCSESDLLRVTGIGPGVIAELRAALAEFDPPQDHPTPRGMS